MESPRGPPPAHSGVPAHQDPTPAPPTRESPSRSRACAEATKGRSTPGASNSSGLALGQGGSGQLPKCLVRQEKSPWRPVVWSVALGLTLRDAGRLQPLGLNLLSQPTWGAFKELLVTGLGTNSSHHVQCIINSGHQHYPDFLISGSESLHILNKKPRMRICSTKLLSLAQFTNILSIS